MEQEIRGKQPHAAKITRTNRIVPPTQYWGHPIMGYTPRLLREGYFRLRLASKR